ncbi:cation-translocating P-type ATPase [Candidatus Dependentiae bacterium]|nr:cation-translocating P-type ATPase [Candidatus Dependentiae bacterium]
MKNSVLQSYHLPFLAYILFSLTLYIAYLWLELPQVVGYGALLLALAPIAYEGIQELFEGKISTELFVTIATGIALIGHQESAITVVLFIMLCAHYIEDLIRERTDDALSSLVKLIPTDVLVKKDGLEHTVPLESVIPGDLLVIKTGGRVPVDGVVVEGAALVQEAFLTGESVPQDKQVGSLLFAGTYLEEGSVILKAEKIGENTLFGKISLLLEEAGERKAKVVVLADRIASIFTPLFLLFCLGAWLYTKNLSVVITLLIFGSPLELALVTPLTFLAAMVAAFRRGILIKSQAALEYLAYTDTIVFDKTGTLTLGSSEVASIVSLDERFSEEDILLIAATAEKRSGHSMAKAISDYARQHSLSVPDPDSYISLTGHGISITYQGKRYMVGNRHFMEAKEHGNLAIPCSSSAFEHMTTFYVAAEDAVIGEICLADRIRPDAASTISSLRERIGERLFLLSGDKQQVADEVGKQLGILHVYGKVMPAEKLAILKKMQQEGHTVTMVGDGINDAPALKQADVGIAMGGMGMEPAIAAADIVLMSSHLDQLVFLQDLAHAALRTVKINLIIGFALTHSIGIILALMRLINPIQAALFHAVPDFLILYNATRLIRFKGR